MFTPLTSRGADQPKPSLPTEGECQVTPNESQATDAELMACTKAKESFSTAFASPFHRIQTLSGDIDRNSLNVPAVSRPHCTGCCAYKAI